uniref:Retrovirus-related Pol polyprotein from transposon TNT 1-94-like beta-barrel domain-containing protein n=2 Tax=Tanacetum cinerariifolium TaxID=118510 RepID=A0A6L2KQY7_TANCI|nr:hypothetical protein [Tanacetum cinerariifolium]
MDLETAQTTTTTKLPILKQGEYDMWRLRIEQYFQALKDCKSAGYLSTNEVNIAYGVNTANTQVSPPNTKVSTPSTQDSIANLSDATIYAFLASQPNESQLIHEDLVQIHEDDLKEMYLKWQSYMADDEVPTNMALMAFLDSEELQHPEFKGYGPKTSNSVSEYISNEVKESTNAPLVKELVLDDKLEKKIVFPTVTKIEFVRPKQQEKPVRKPVKYAKMYRLTAITIKGKEWPTAVNIAWSNSAVVNVVRANQINVAKALACWVWRPTELYRESITLKKHNYGHPQKVQEYQRYVDSGCSRHMTGNMSYLSDFKEFNGGYVTFGGGANDGRIIGKGTIKTGILVWLTEFCDKHNMVSYIKKPTGSEGFQDIVDFLNGSHIRTVDNGEQEITATVDGKEFTVTEASVRRHLQLADANEEGEGSGHPTEPQPPPSTAQPTNEEPIPNEWDDRVERATTTAASLDAEQASGNINRTQSMAMPNVPLPQGIGAGRSPRRRRAVSTGSGGISTASRLFSTAEESVSTAGASMLVSIVGMVQEVNISIPSPVAVKDKVKGKMEESKDEQTKRTKLQQEQDRLGHEVVVRLQEELDEEERQRMTRVHEAAQSFNEEEWENIRA